jgi:hypothetical protein
VSRYAAAACQALWAANVALTKSHPANSFCADAIESIAVCRFVFAEPGSLSVVVMPFATPRSRKTSR